MVFDEIVLREAHAHSSKHRVEIESNSDMCGCFFCLDTFPAAAIEEWCDDGDTAHCPECWIDAVIGDASGFPVGDPAFLEQMKKLWF